MVKVEKAKNGDALVIEMTGSIEECLDFDPLFGAVTGEIHVNTKGVSRINSVGVKGWIKYFQGLRGKGIKVLFINCSVAIVEQLNLISNFACGGTVESIYVPFICESCGMGSAAPFTVETLKTMNFQIPDSKCPKCGQKAVFDDVPEEYFAFLK